MLRHLRRPAALVMGTLLLAPALTACGGEASTGYGDPTAEGFDAVTISGEFGAAPEVEWKREMTVEDTEVKTLVEGTGETIEAGDQALAYIWLGNGTTQAEAFSDYANGQPEQLTADEEQLSEVFVDLLTGAKVGSRLAAVTTSEDVFGETGNPELGIGNADTILVVMDVTSAVLDAVEGTEQPAPAWAPQITTGDNGLPTGFTFDPKSKPKKGLQKAVLIEGTGPEVGADATVVARYLGQVWGGTEPFDENFSGEPTSFSLNGVVAGWKEGLTGVKVGSRVLLSIPPELGYGEQGNEQAGIKGTDTLVFVVDVLAAG